MGRGRKKDFDAKVVILNALARSERPMTMRELQRETGLSWGIIWYWLRDKENDGNLVLKGCVEEEKIVGEVKNIPQDMFRYRLTEFGRKYCLPKFDVTDTSG